ncbi:MAG: M48 family metalloprotease [Oscillospiraceae bacterium]|nr:M48 family metalloprotease [Oscillospiraceae bacterium]
MEILKQLGIKSGLFLRSNWAYIIWFALHYLLAVAVLTGFVEHEWQAYLWAGIFYAVSIGIALSPVGEAILRRLQGANPIQTEQDENYLMPLFEEVYAEALEQTPSLHKGIKLYISEEKIINGYAMGRKTVVLTRGAIESFSRAELKGILAHEFGHMANGDTKAGLMTVIGNSVFSLIILACKIIMWAVNILVSLVTEQYIGVNIIHFVIRLIFDYSVVAFLFAGNVILSLNSRYSEFLADDYARKLGYGEELKRGLYLLNKLNMGGRRSVRDWLMASHPHTPARIKRLERKLELEKVQ